MAMAADCARLIGNDERRRMIYRFYQSLPRDDKTHNAHVHTSQLTLGLGLRIMRDCSEILTHSRKRGCRAAHASMAHEMARSSCCPGGQV